MTYRKKKDVWSTNKVLLLVLPKQEENDPGRSRNGNMAPLPSPYFYLCPLRPAYLLSGFRRRLHNDLQPCPMFLCLLRLPDGQRDGNGHLYPIADWLDNSVHYDDAQGSWRTTRCLSIRWINWQHCGLWLASFLQWKSLVSFPWSWRTQNEKERTWLTSSCRLKSKCRWWSLACQVIWITSWNGKKQVRRQLYLSWFTF